MTPEFVLGFSKEAMDTAMLICAPLLLTSLVVGLVVSIFQAVTQIQEATLTFIPKMIAMGLVTYWAGGWMMQTLMEFTRHTFTLVSGMKG
jgi:flagellar biosynthetic protein FliQ